MSEHERLNQEINRLKQSLAQEDREVFEKLLRQAFSPGEEPVHATFVSFEREHSTDRRSGEHRSEIETIVNRYHLDKVPRLIEDVEQIKQSIPYNVVVVEEVSREEAKNRVETYLKEHGKADTEELMLKLKIDLRTLLSILDELRKEGKIEDEGQPE